MAAVHSLPDLSSPTAPINYLDSAPLMGAGIGAGAETTLKAGMAADESRTSESSLTLPAGNYIYDPYQRTFLRFPELNTGTHSTDPNLLVISQIFQPSPDHHLLKLSDLKGIRTGSRAPSLASAPDSAASSIDIAAGVGPSLHDLSPLKKRTTSSSSSDSGHPLHPTTVSILKADEDLPHPTSFPWSRIPLLLELYCHLQRVINALIPDERIKKNAAEAIWVTVCIGILEDLAKKAKLLSNTKVARNRLLCARNIENQVVLEIKSREIKTSPDKVWKSRLQEKTAGPFDLLFINQTLGVQTLITPPTYLQSSHSKKIMPPAVVPMTHTFQHPITGALKSHTRYRVPSIGASIYDGKKYSVKENLAFALSLIPQSSSRLTCYHLLTSLPKVDPNHQVKTAHDLFQAAHQLNQESLRKSGTLKVLIFNIPVNQHTEFFSYTHSFSFFSSHRKTLPEALVMADLALIFKLSTWRTLDPKIAERIQELKAAYQAFLGSYSPKKSSYFSEYRYRNSPKGVNEKIIDKLSFIKKALLDETFMKSDSYAFSPRDLMEKALIKLYVIKYDGRDKKIIGQDQRIYGLPVQSLFMALDDHNLAGCKSANERFFLTEGLAQTLQAFMEETLPTEIQTKMTQAFRKFLELSLSTKTFEDFIKFLLETHNDLNPYGSSIGPSLLDTGTPKCDVEQSKEGNPLEIKALVDTNTFAPHIYTNIAQQQASKVQAHGGALTSRLEYALKHEGNPEALRNARIRVVAKAAHVLLHKPRVVTDADWEGPIPIGNEFAFL
jgi:hypothetical protein